MPKKKKKSDPKPRVIIIESPLETFVRGAVLTLFFASFLTPFFSFDFFYHTHRFTKTMLYFGAIEIMVGLFLLFASRYRVSWAVPPAEDGKKGSKRDWLVLSLLAYLGVTGLSVLYAVDPFQAFWGTMGWANGFLTIAHLTAFFFVVTALFRNRSVWKWLVRWHLFTCLLLAVWAVWQHLDGTTPFASFGNTGYLAGYLLFGFFGSIFLFLWEKEWDTRILPTIAAFATVCVIFFVTDVRSAQVGVLAGLSAIGALRLLASTKRAVRVGSTVAIASAIVFAVSFGGYMLSSGKAAQLFERSVTVQTRLTAWNIALDGLRHRPILGYGQENYPVVFEKYFDPGFYEIQSPNEVPMEYTFYQPHNKFLEVAVCGGIVGLIAYLGIYYAFIRTLFLRFRKSRDPRFLVLAGSFVGCGANLFFHFDTATTFFAFFFMLALSYAFLRSPDDENAVMKSDLVAHETPLWVQRGLMVPVVALTGFALWGFVVFPWRTDRIIYDALVSVRSSMDSAQLDRFISQVKTNRLAIQDEAVLEILRSGVATLADKDVYTESERAQLRKLVDLGEYASSQRPEYFLIPAFTGRVANYVGRFDPSYYDRSIRLCEEAVKRGAKRQEVFFVLAETYAHKKDTVKSVEYIKKGIALDPGFGLAYTFAARAYFLLGDAEAGLESLAEGFRQGLRDEGSYNLYLEQARASGNRDRAIEAAKHLADFKPGDPQALANLAMVYYENEDYEQSKLTLELFQKRFPDKAKAADKLLGQIREKLAR